MLVLPALDVFTLLASGVAALPALALCLAALGTVRGDSVEGLRLWVAVLLVYTGHGALQVLMLFGRGVPLAALLSIVSASLLIGATVLQQLAVRQMCRGRLAWASVVVYTVLALVAGAALAWLLPGGGRQALLLTLCHALLQLLAVVQLAPRARHGAGAALMLIGALVSLVGNLVVPLRHGGGDGRGIALALGVDLVGLLLGSAGLLLWYQARLRARLQRSSVTDAPTGVLNRRGLMPRLTQELARAQRSGRPVSLVLFELDHLRQLVSRDGPEAGDAALQRCAERISRLIRRHDVLGRWQGDTFLLILPETALSQALQAAERMRAAQARPEPDQPTVTLSGGVVSAPRDGWGACTPAELVASAEQLLQLARHSGNRIISVGEFEGEAAPTRPPHHA